jgi:predicted dithiol-disulfide oxidoreductase (DUF899 family)
MTTTSTLSDNSFLSLLTAIARYNDREKNNTVSITKKQLEDFEKEYIFEILQTNKSFGVYFCEKFSIIDYILMFEKNHDKALSYITKNYITNDTSSN